MAGISLSEVSGGALLEKKVARGLSLTRAHATPGIADAVGPAALRLAEPRELLCLGTQLVSNDDANAGPLAQAYLLPCTWLDPSPHQAAFCKRNAYFTAQRETAAHSVEGLPLHRSAAHHKFLMPTARYLMALNRSESNHPSASEASVRIRGQRGGSLVLLPNELSSLRLCAAFEPSPEAVDRSV